MELTLKTQQELLAIISQFGPPLLDLVEKTTQSIPHLGFSFFFQTGKGQFHVLKPLGPVLNFQCRKRYSTGNVYNIDIGRRLYTTVNIQDRCPFVYCPFPKSESVCQNGGIIKGGDSVKRTTEYRAFAV